MAPEDALHRPAWSWVTPLLSWAILLCFGLLGAVIGLCLVVGGPKNHVQQFHVGGMADALCTMTVIVVLTMVLPNYTKSSAGGTYNSMQLGFTAFSTLTLFVVALTLRTGNTTIQPGIVHLVIFAIYLFFSVVP